MSAQTNRKDVDKKRYPHRGIYSEIARERGLKRQTVWQAIEVSKRPDLVALYKRKLAARVRMMEGQ